MSYNDKKYSTKQFEQTTKKAYTYLRSLANRRSSGVVTADDVHAFLNKEGVKPEQVRTRLRFINSVLREPMFEQDGTVSSTRPAAKGRTISAWTIA